MIGRPSSVWDLHRVRQHDWAKVDGEESAVCGDCGLDFDDATWLANIPACPGPGFRLIRRGRHEAP